MFREKREKFFLNTDSIIPIEKCSLYIILCAAHMSSPPHSSPTAALVIALTVIKEGGRREYHIISDILVTGMALVALAPLK